MKCPACFNELSSLCVGGFEVDVCRNGCGGVWFDAFELQKVDEVHETEGNILFHVPRDPAVVVDQTAKRLCPRCTGVKLMRHYFSPKRRVQVDHCPNCAGYWLDAGELDLIQSERSAAHKSPEPEGLNISSDLIRYLYRLEHGAPPRRRIS